jgi:hypothetical protein
MKCGFEKSSSKGEGAGSGAAFSGLGMMFLVEVDKR